MYSLYLLPGYLRAGEYYNMVAILYGRKKSKLTVVHTAILVLTRLAGMHSLFQISDTTADD